MKFSLFFAVLLLLAACQQQSPIVNSPSVDRPDGGTGRLPNEIPEEVFQDKSPQWLFANSWTLVQYVHSNGNVLRSFEPVSISISANALSFPDDCNSCSYGIRIDSLQRKIIDVNPEIGAICTELACPDDTGDSPAQPAFRPAAEYSYRRVGTQLHLSNEQGTFVFSPAAQMPASLVGTRWQIFAYEKDAYKQRRYVDEFIYVGFGKDYLDYSPDCNSCTLQSEMNYEGGKISWNSKDENKRTCTQKGCLDEKNKDFGMNTISNGMEYRFSGDVLVLENNKIRLFLRPALR